MVCDQGKIQVRRRLLLSVSTPNPRARLTKESITTDGVLLCVSVNVEGEDSRRGQSLGTMKREFALLRRIYSVFDPNDRRIFQLFGPILHPWTFEIRDDSKEYGQITKQWSGALKEGFTDADNFGVTFPNDWSNEQKALFLGTVFLIDFVHFEDKGNR